MTTLTRYTDADAERFHAWMFGLPGSRQGECPGCRRPHFRNPGDDPGTHIVHADGCPYLAWCEEHLDTIEIIKPECTCDTRGLYSPGTVESIRAGETDPFCTEHGVDEVTSGTYQAMSRAEQRQFRLRLFAQLTTMDDD